MDSQSKSGAFLEKVPQSRSDRGDKIEFEWLNRESGCPQGSYREQRDAD
jgi:hypothetical protein